MTAVGTERARHSNVARSVCQSAALMVEETNDIFPAQRQRLFPPLHEALIDGDGELAGTLIAQGADLTEADVVAGATPLHYASWCGDRDLASVRPR